MPAPFARSRSFWRVMGRAVGVGLLAGLAVLAFLGAEHLLTDLLWEDETPTGFGDLGWIPVVVIMVAALAVGLQRRWAGLHPPDPNFVDEMLHGRTDPRAALQLVLLGLTSLVGGASLGPEAPIATAGAGLGTLVGDPGRSRDETSQLNMAGISGALGALMTFPFAGPLMALEVQEDREFGRYERLVPGLITATVALAVVFPVIGAPFAGLYAIEPPDLDMAALALAVPLGLLGAAVGVLAILLMALAGGLFARLQDPLVRAVVGGVVVAVVGSMAPLTLFSGRDQFAVVLDDPTRLGPGLMIAVVLGKLVVFAVCMRSGYFGGPIFPLLFLGGVTGLVVHELVPQMSLSLAITCAAGGATIAVLGLPLTVLVFLVVVFALGPVGSIAPAVAIVSAFVAIHGTGLLGWLADRLGPGAPPEDLRPAEDVTLPRG